MNSYGEHLDKYTMLKSFNMWNPTRALGFWTRFYMYAGLFNRHYSIPFNFVRPGLEIKYACEEANKGGSKLYFLGPEFNQLTWQRLVHETRTTVLSYFWRYIQFAGHYHWYEEREGNINKMHNSEASQFTEQCADPHLINWYVQNMDMYFPRLKEIFVDQRDQDLFKAIDKCPEKRIVVVVNQWHMEGIEHEWAHSYGQMPRSV